MQEEVIDGRTGALIPYEGAPAMTIDDAVEKYRAMVRFVKKTMHREIDYGVIPGTTKPTLFKPGAEKLASFFGLRNHIELLNSIEDWTGADHGGEPFFHYSYRVTLIRDGEVRGQGIGSCNSWEKKYRWRDQKRVCPICNKPTIIKGKEQYGGGWLCFKKIDGCGEKYKDDDPRIVGQVVGQVPNPEIFDIVNTLDKMAQKRAFMQAVLVTTNASEFFTQDLDKDREGEGEEDGKGHTEDEPQTETLEEGRARFVKELANYFTSRKALAGAMQELGLSYTLEDHEELKSKLREYVDKQKESGEG